MTLRSLIILVAAVALIACSKSDDKKAGDDKTAAAPAGGGDKAPAKPAAPYSGPLDEGRLKQAKDGVKPFQKWDAANAHLLATVGAPHETDGNDHYWYLLDGDKCHELQVENANGEVGAVGLGAYDKAMKSKYDKCLAHSGDGGDTAAGDDDDDGDDGDDGAEPAAVKKKVMKKKKADDGNAKADDGDDDDGGW